MEFKPRPQQEWSTPWKWNARNAQLYIIISPFPLTLTSFLTIENQLMKLHVCLIIPSNLYYTKLA